MSGTAPGSRAPGPRRPRDRRARLALVAVALAGAVAGPWLLVHAPPALPAVGQGPMLEVTELASGLSTPWDLDFTPEGDLLFTERDVGTLSVLTREGELRLVGRPPRLFVPGNSGLMSVVVDPDFASNRRVYLCYGSHPVDPALDPGGEPEIRVGAFRVAPGYAGLAASGPPLVRIPLGTAPDGLVHHVGCRVELGEDGHLWIGTGDASQPAYPQDTKVLAGKVLRVDRRTGEGVSGNPFFDSPDANRRRVYSFGHRNVQGLAFQPDGDAVFAVEHGTYRDDEINRLVPGGNYGWDPGSGKPDSRDPMTDLAKFPDAVEAAWSSGDPTLAPGGATFLADRGPVDWGSWRGGLVVAHLKARHLRIYRVDRDGRLAGHVSALIDEHGRLRSVTQGPDGALYLTTSNIAKRDKLLRVAPRAGLQVADGSP